MGHGALNLAECAATIHRLGMVQSQIEGSVMSERGNLLQLWDVLAAVRYHP